MDAKGTFEAGGAKVISGDAVPPNIRRALARPIERVRDTLRRPVPFARIKAPKRWTYSDDRCDIVFPIPRVDVFAAFELEMAGITADVDPMEGFERLARAFAILHIRPHWYQRSWIPYFDIDTEKAVDFLMRSLRSDIILGSLPKAMVEFHDYIVGAENLKKNEEVKTTADTPKP
jgi:hypothetical protein